MGIVWKRGWLEASWGSMSKSTVHCVRIPPKMLLKSLELCAQKFQGIDTGVGPQKDPAYAG